MNTFPTFHLFEPAPMPTSMQATRARINEPRSATFPFRLVVLEQLSGGWRRLAVSEWESAAIAEEVGLDMCTEPYEFGVLAMHYYVGEVAL